MPNEKEKIIQTYRDYCEACESLVPEAVLPFYHTPWLYISSEETSVITTQEETVASFARMMDMLRKADYTRTDIIKISARQMSKDLALESVDLERYDSNEEQLGGIGKTYTYAYTLRKTDDLWKIIVVMAHDPETILNLDYK